MGDRTSYTHGTFCWTDLSTSDPAAGKVFYAGLFGWEAQDIPTPMGMTYTLLSLDGKTAAALSAQQPQEHQQGIPPHWNSYISVDDVDAAVERVDQSGGITIDEPFDVMEAGRMAVVQDPTGAVVCLWQAKSSIGARLVNAPGALTWNELTTNNPEQSKAFFADLLGWTYEDVRPGHWMIKNGDALNGAISQQNQQEAGVMPNWVVYFAADNIDAALEQVSAGGGRALTPKIHIDVGTLAVVADPQGAVFALYAGQLDP